MNYYPFHIGDYASATRHLSWEEDLAYRRLLDWCYTNEKPLPAELTKVCRLVVATNDAQRVAVETVLSEFFVATGDGWLHERVTGELERMREKQEVNEERDEHEKTRQQKHRERRSAMFAQLAEVGVYPAWNAKTGELERLIQDNCDKPVTHAAHSENVSLVTEPVTPVTDSPSQQGQPATASSNAPATAIPTPTPTPTPKKKNTSAIAAPDGVSDSVWNDFLKIRAAKKAPMTDTALDVIRAEAQIAGIDLSAALKICCARGWQGFKAKWLDEKYSTPHGSKSQTGAAWEGAR